MTRATSVGEPLRMACQIALCSLSTGITSAPFSEASCFSSPPPITSASLLASANEWPASRAPRAAGRPAPPVMALNTRSASGQRATSQTPSSPHSSSVRVLPTASSSPCRYPVSTRAATRGENSLICPASARHREHALSATTSNRSGMARITSSALVPTEPVEPSMTILFLADFFIRFPSRPSPVRLPIVLVLVLKACRLSRVPTSSARISLASLGCARVSSAAYNVAALTQLNPYPQFRQEAHGAVARNPPSWFSCRSGTGSRSPSRLRSRRLRLRLPPARSPRSPLWRS